MYLLVSICIPHVSVLDQRRIQNLVKYLRWIFLQKLLMALAR